MKVDVSGHVLPKELGLNPAIWRAMATLDQCCFSLRIEIVTPDVWGLFLLKQLPLSVNNLAGFRVMVFNVTL